MPLRLPALLAALLLALAACSGDGTEDGGTPDGAEEVGADADQDVAAGPDGTVTFVGLSNLQWERTERSASLADGPLEVTIVCEGPVPHNVVFEGVADDAVIAVCSGDDAGSGTVDVEPGTYTYYCAIPGHRTAGMQGTISIR